jgi:hypothetical protein
VAAQAVVGRPLLLVLQRLVGLGDVLEALGGVFFLRHVGVVLAGEPAIGLLDDLIARSPLHAEDLVVILVFHPG